MGALEGSVVRVVSAFVDAMIGSVAACQADPSLESPLDDPEVQTTWHAALQRVPEPPLDGPEEG